MNRVVFFVPSLQIGGAENQLRYLATGINGDEFEPVVWCPGCWGPVGDALRDAGVSVLDHNLDLSGTAAVDELLGWLRDLGASIFYSFATDPFWVDAVLAKTAGIPICITRRANTRYADNAGVRNSETDVIVANCAAVAAASL